MPRTKTRLGCVSCPVSRTCGLMEPALLSTITTIIQRAVVSSPSLEHQYDRDKCRYHGILKALSMCVKRLIDGSVAESNSGSPEASRWTLAPEQSGAANRGGRRMRRLLRKRAAVPRLKLLHEVAMLIAHATERLILTDEATQPHRIIHLHPWSKGTPSFDPTSAI